jgi:hypothetical protein
MPPAPQNRFVSGSRKRNEVKRPVVMGYPPFSGPAGYYYKVCQSVFVKICKTRSLYKQNCFVNMLYKLL